MSESIHAQPVDLAQLAAFYEVAKGGSLRAAAARLGRSQPAISHRLRALTEDLGVPLFEKLGRGVKLTDHGRALLEDCQEIMALSAAIRRSVAAGTEDLRGELILGTLPTLASHLLVDELGRFLAGGPRVKLTMRFGLNAKLIDELLSGRIDVALLVTNEPPARASARLLGQVQLQAVLPRRSLSSKRRTISPRELAGRTYLSWAGLDDPSMAIVDKYARRHGLTSDRSPVIPHIDTLRELIARGVGYTFLPSYTVRRDVSAGRVMALRAVGLEESIAVYVVTRLRQPETPALAAVLRFIERAAKQLRPS